MIRFESACLQRTHVTKVNYFRFDDRTFSVDDGNPSFPRKSGPWWFGCGKDKKAVLKNEDGAAFSLFEDEGDELLDVYPGDEYFQE